MKPLHINIRIKYSTYEELTKMQALYQFAQGKRVSLDGLIRELIDSQPRIDLRGKLGAGVAKANKQPA